MKFMIVFVALFAVALAAPAAPGDQDAQVLRLDSDVQPEGYKFGLETSNGIKRDEDGQLKNVGSEDEALVVHGSYTFVDPEGHSHTINFVADENGYQPQGEDVPVAPVV